MDSQVFVDVTANIKPSIVEFVLGLKEDLEVTCDVRLSRTEDMRLQLQGKAAAVVKAEQYISSILDSIYDRNKAKATSSKSADRRKFKSSSTTAVITTINDNPPETSAEEAPVAEINSTSNEHDQRGVEESKTHTQEGEGKHSDASANELSEDESHDTADEELIMPQDATTEESLESSAAEAQQSVRKKTRRVKPQVESKIVKRKDGPPALRVTANGVHLDAEHQAVSGQKELQPEAVQRNNTEHIDVDVVIWKYIAKMKHEYLEAIKNQYHVKIIPKRPTENGVINLSIKGSLQTDAAKEKLCDFIAYYQFYLGFDRLRFGKHYKDDDLQEIVEGITADEPDFMFEKDDNILYMAGPKKGLHKIKSLVLMKMIANTEKAIDKTSKQKDRSSTRSLDSADPAPKHKTKELTNRAPEHKRKEVPVPKPAPAPVGHGKLHFRTIASYQTVKKKRVHIFYGDITKLPVAAIVNAANSRLDHVGGVAQAISTAAGPELQEHCTSLVREYGEVEVCRLRITPGFHLPARSVIHVVGPMWHTFGEKQKFECLRQLHVAFRNCLDAAERQKFSSVAVPSISSGVYGVPLENVVTQMFGAVMDFVDSAEHVTDVVLVDVAEETMGLLCEIFTKETNTYKRVTPMDNLLSLQAPIDPNLSEDTPHKPNHSTQSAGTSTSTRHKLSKAATLPSSTSTTRCEGRKSARSRSVPAAPRRSSDTCNLCRTELVEPTQLPCQHVFCGKCIETWLAKKASCPSCGTLVGEVRGNQPEGKMEVFSLNIPVPGYRDAKRALMIEYSFTDGTQKSNHPSPGERYYGTIKRAFLPETKEGIEILRLLERAFAAKIMFTIGRSSSAGPENQIIFNGIRHKTSASGGSEKNGYPDPGYLENVRRDLARKGITA